jgi:hypothetical protein
MLCSRRTTGRPEPTPREFVVDQLPRHVAQDRYDLPACPDIGGVVRDAKVELLRVYSPWAPDVAPGEPRLLACPPMSVSVMLTLVALRLPTRTVAAGPRCGAQVPGAAERSGGALIKYGSIRQYSARQDGGQDGGQDGDGARWGQRVHRQGPRGRLADPGTNGQGARRGGVATAS